MSHSHIVKIWYAPRLIGGAGEDLELYLYVWGIGGNHGHRLPISEADVTAGADKTYDITGQSGHSHSVTVTAAMFAELQSRRALNSTVSAASAFLANWATWLAIGALGPAAIATSTSGGEGSGVLACDYPG